MIWILVVICLIYLVCRPSRFEAHGPVGSGEPSLERHAAERPVRNLYHRPSNQPEAALIGVVEKFSYFMGVLIREVTPILKVILVETLIGLGWLAVEIGWGLLWLFLATEKVLGIGWRRFDSFCRDQIDPNWKIDQMEAQAQAEMNLHKANYQSYRQETIKKIEEQKELAEAKQIALAWEIEEMERFSQEQLGLLAEQFAALSEWAEGELHKQQMVASHCPHCGKKVFLARKAANKIVKCPYRDCRGRIKVSVCL